MRGAQQLAFAAGVLAGLLCASTAHASYPGPASGNAQNPGFGTWDYHESSGGPNGGAATSTAWTQRKLTSLLVDTEGSLGLSSNKFFLTKGDWIVRATIVALSDASVQVAGKIRIRNTDDNVTACVGISGSIFYASGASGGTNFFLQDYVNVPAGGKHFEIDYYLDNGDSAAYGLGYNPASWGENEVYVQLNCQAFDGPIEQVQPCVNSLGTVIYANEQTSGTAAGTSTGGAWTVYPITAQKAATQAGLTTGPSSNQFTLTSGGWKFRAWATYNGGGSNTSFKIRVRNVTGSSTIAAGTNVREAGNQGPSSCTSVAYAEGSAVLGGTTTIEIDYYAETGTSTNGLGQACSSGQTERYMVVVCEKYAN